MEHVVRQLVGNGQVLVVQLVLMYTTGGARNSLMVCGTMGRTSGSASSASTCFFRNSVNAGRSKYQFSTGRISGVTPVSDDFGAIRSSGAKLWPRSHSSA